MSSNIEYIVNQRGLDYVGIRIEKGKIVVKLPVGYNYEESNPNLKSEIKELITLLAKKTKIDGVEIDQKDDINIDYISAIKIVNDYLNYGLYKQTEWKERRNGKGRINWTKTLHQNQIYLKDKIIYNNWINEYIDYKCEKEIQQIQEYCLYQISKNLGFILDFSYSKIANKFTKNEMISIISKELEKTNEDIKMEILKNLITYVRNTNLDAVDKGNISIKYKEFNYIWEGLVDEFGIEGEAKRKYNPRAGYYYIDNDKKKEENIDPLRPDTIIKNMEGYEDKVFVLDAKYYREGHLPGEYDIFKQTRYGEYARNILDYKEEKDKRIINAFILPKNLEKENKIIELKKYYARCENAQDIYANEEKRKLKDYERIYVMYVNTKSLILDTKNTMKKVLELLNMEVNASCQD